jgi:hypothetical protein
MKPGPATRAGAFAIAAMGIEALALHALLFKLRRWGRIGRTVAAVGLFAALSA